MMGSPAMNDICRQNPKEFLFGTTFLVEGKVMRFNQQKTERFLYSVGSKSMTKCVQVSNMGLMIVSFTKMWQRPPTHD